MCVHLIRRLEQILELDPGARQALANLASLKVRPFGPREDIVREGDQPIRVNLVVEGWLCRYKLLPDGRRQILAFMLPGDFCDIRTALLPRMDHSIGTLTPARVAEIPKHVPATLTAKHPGLSQALTWQSLIEEATYREWIVNNSQRDATERLAHLLCELFVRLGQVGLAEANACEFPLTQNDLGDALGLSTVHVNRTLQELRASGLIVLKGKSLTLPDLAALQQVALFDPGYLVFRPGRSRRQGAAR